MMQRPTNSLNTNKCEREGPLGLVIKTNCPGQLVGDGNIASRSQGVAFLNNASITLGERKQRTRDELLKCGLGI